MRLKKYSFDQKIIIGRKIKKICKTKRVKFIVNDDPLLARRLGADGCHLGQKDMKIEKARSIIGNKIIGITCHNSLRLAKNAINSKVNYLAFGAFYQSKTKKTKYAHTEFGISKDASIIAMISALDPRKGHTLLIKAAQNVIKHGVDTHFLIVGDHPKNQTKYKNHLIKLVDELGLNDHITFTGYQNDIHKILNSIELLIQPSVTDAGPLVPLESMSCGIPVIATDVGGNPEEILHGHTGLIIPPDDPLVLSQSIVKLLQDKDLMLKMRHNARKWTKTKFDSRLLTDTIENIYDEILEQRQHVG